MILYMNAEFICENKLSMTMIAESMLKDRICNSNMENSLAMFTCRRCGYESNKKCNLLTHLQRKNTCKATLEDIDIEELIHDLTKREINGKAYLCEHCKKPFSTRQGKYQHMKICNIEPETLLPISEVNSLIEQKVKEVLATMQLPNVTSNNNTTNNNTTNNNTNNGTIINNNVTIQIRNFNHENMDAIPKEFVHNCFRELEFATLFENLHFDPDYPENHNVRMKNSKSNLMGIYKNDSWKYVHVHDGLKEVVWQLWNIFNKVPRSELVENGDMSQEEVDDNDAKLQGISDSVEQGKLSRLECVRQIKAVLANAHAQCLKAA